MPNAIITSLYSLRRCSFEDARAGSSFSVLDGICFAEEAVKLGQITATERMHFVELLTDELFNSSINRRKDYQAALRKVLFGSPSEHPDQGVVDFALLVELNHHGRTQDRLKFN